MKDTEKAVTDDNRFFISKAKHYKMELKKKAMDKYEREHYTDRFDDRERKEFE